eukprot:TRINITY_DN358_c0_g1_i1.p2 TRINITY_DN358_c0_g1~~TRINITY_DN358_c0_g1_i1.p2  ORF type:complete len:659 (+),score=103.84 TRINITY_DN358_c0_g1_i1:75-1979(+)
MIAYNSHISHKILQRDEQNDICVCISCASSIHLCGIPLNIHPQVTPAAKYPLQKRAEPRADEDCFLYQVLIGVSMAFNLGFSIDDIYSRVKLSSVNKKIEEQAKEIDQLKKSLKEVTQENSHLREENADLNRTVVILRENNKVLQEKNEELTREVRDLKDANQRLLEEITQLKEKVTELENELTKKDEKIAELQLGLKKQDAEIMYLNAANAIYGKVVEIQKASIAEKTETINKLKVDVSKKNFEIAGLKAANALLKQTVEIDEKIIVEKEQTLVEKENVIKKQAVEISSEEAQKTLLKKAIQLEEEVIAKKDGVIHDKDIVILQQTTTIAAKEATIILLEAAVNIQKETIVKQKVIIDTQNKTIDDLEKKVQSLTDENESLKEEVKTLNLQLSELKEIIKKFNDEHKECQIAWVKARVLEGITQKHVNLKKVYSAPKENCDRKDFHSKCGNIGPNLFIATEADTDLQFGGFTMEKFDGKSDWKTDKRAFTFSLTTLSKCDIKDPTHAIYARETHNLFQHNVVDFGQWDIWIEDACLQKGAKLELNKTYECPSNKNKYFYASTNKPKLSSFEFYQVEVINDEIQSFNPLDLISLLEYLINEALCVLMYDKTQITSLQLSLHGIIANHVSDQASI